MTELTISSQVHENPLFQHRDPGPISNSEPDVPLAAGEKSHDEEELRRILEPRRMAGPMSTNFSQTAAYIWSLADLLRGDFKQSQYGRVILPFTILRRLECVLQPTKDAVLDQVKTLTSMAGLEDEARGKFLLKAAGQSFYNTSPMDLSKMDELASTRYSLSTPYTYHTSSSRIYKTRAHGAAQRATPLLQWVPISTIRDLLV